MRLFKTNTTFLQIMVGFVPVILLMFFVGYGVIYFQVRETVKTEVIENLKSISVRHANQIESHVSHIMRDMESLLNHDQLTPNILTLETVYKRSGLDSPEYSTTEEHIGHIFRDTVRIRKYYDLFVITPDGEIIYTVKKEADLGTNLKTGPYKDSGLGKLYQQVLSDMQVSISPFKYYEASKEIAGFIAAPIFSNKEIKGVMAFQINTDRFLEIVQDYTGLKETGETVVAAKVGNEAIFITPLRFDPEAPMKRPIPFGSSQGVPIQKAVQGGFGQGFSMDYRGKEILAVWSHLASIDWGMVVKIDKSEAFTPVQKIQDYFVNASIALVAVVLLMAFFLSKSISEEVSASLKIPQQEEEFRPSFTKKGSLANKIIFSSLIPLVFVAVLGFSTYKAIEFSQETKQWVEHTNLVLTRALQIEKLMVDMETGERGFLITGEEHFLEPYNFAHTRIDSLIDEVTSLVSDNPTQVERMHKIKQLIDQWENAAGNPAIELRRKVDVGEADFSELTAFIASEIGKKVFDELRQKMEAFKGAEYSLKSERKERDTRTAALSKQIIIWGTMAVLLLSWLISYLVSKVITRPVSLLAQTAEKVSRGNLSARVQKITQDEIGGLSHSFNQMLDGLQNEMKARQQTQLELENSTLQNELILNSAGEGIYGLDMNGIAIFVNASAENLLGYEKAEILGKSMHPLVHHTKADGSPCRKEICPSHKAMVDGVTYRSDQEVFWKKDGTSFPVECVSSPKFENGELVGAVVVFTDITERQLAQQSQAYLASIVEGTDQGVVGKDLDGRIVSWNQGAEKMYGYSSDEIVGEKIHKIIPEDRYGEVENFLSQIKQGNRIDHYETVRVRKDGTHIDLLLTISPIRDINEKIIGASAISTDITEKKKTQDALEETHNTLEQKLKELEEKTTEMERFTYTVSHDLKSPLITIGSFVGFLGRDVKEGDSEKIGEDLKHIKMALEKMQSLLDELLELSRIGRLVNPPEVVSLTSMAKQACSLVAGTISSRGVEVEIVPDMPKIKCDRPRIEEVFQNLIENAVKFMGDQQEPRINIGYKQEEGRIVCFVQDNGVGIDAQYKDRIFRLFEKLDTVSEGTGIGLSIVKRVLTIHGGSVWLESQGIGKGTTFYFSFPETLHIKE